MAAMKAPAKKALAKRTAAPVVTEAPAPAPSATAGAARDLESIPLTMTIEIGGARDTIGRVQEYGEQSIVDLDSLVSDPVDILLNGQLWARGEVVTVGERFGVRVVEILSTPGG